MLLYVLLLGCCLQFQAAQECSSPTYNFATHVNADELDLTTPPDSIIARFPVENVQSVSVIPQPVYLSARLVGSELHFVTTANFSQYEEHELQIIIILQMSYTCTTGQRQGLYRQNLKLANNHAPRFLEDVYHVLVPLPLPKNFDISPYLANGLGVMARDIDLINNTVRFSVSENDYFNIESHSVAGNSKQFKAILRLREQILKLAGKVEVTVTATDRGIPPRASQVSLIMQPDLSIIYDDPPEFKDTFVNRTLEKDVILQLELIPGTETSDVQYTLEGSDSEYFSLSVWANNSGFELKLVNLEALPRAKSFLNVLAVGKRSELQKTSSVILLTIPPENGGSEAEKTTVQKVLVVLYLEEMAQHRNIFPLTIEKCIFTIESQTPGEYFFIDETDGTLSSKPFDREDEELFSGLDFPQFWLVLKLNCPNIPDPALLITDADPNSPGPMKDIPYSTDRTHLNIIVQDINDNSPEFSYPPNNALLAFPSARLAQILLPERLVKVEASDRDEGLNAIIRYRVAVNGHFDIDPGTGVVFPLKSAMLNENTTTLEVYATDRDGAEDGNTSTMKIRVFRASEDQLVALTVDDIDPLAFEKLLQEIHETKNVKVGTVKSVYSVTADSNESSGRVATARYATKTVLYAFEGERLLPYSEIVGILKTLQTNYTLNFSTMNELYMSYSRNTENESTIIYPYIIVAAFFGTLAIAMAAAAFYYRAKTRRSSGNDSISPSETASDNSNAVIVEKGHNDYSSTPPLEHSKQTVKQLHDDADPTKLPDNPPLPRTAARSLLELLSIEEIPENDESNGESHRPAQTERKKSIKFNEHVERIEVYDKEQYN